MRTLTTALVVVLASASAARADDWGTVKGKVTWGGADAAPRKKINVDKDKDHCLSKGDIYDDEVVVGKDGGVRWVLVYLTDADPKKKLPIHPKLAAPEKKVVMDQPCCRFEPRVMGMREGQILVGKNSSPIPHNMNVQGGADNPNKNILIPAGGEIDFDGFVAARSPVLISCSIHSWMKAYIRVFDHPYFTTTDEDGKFEIKNAPAGKYHIVMWQESVGWVTEGGRGGQEIVIPKGDAATVNVKLKPAAPENK